MLRVIKRAVAVIRPDEVKKKTLASDAETGFMFLSKWCLFKIQKENLTTVKFISTNV